MKKLALALGVLALSTTGVFAQQTVRIATEGGYAPYNFINDKGEVDGYERELGDELCKRAGLTCSWVVTDWDAIIPNLTAGNYDAIMAGMSITEERKQKVAFTQNYTPPSASLYVGLTAEPNIKGVVAAQTGTIQANHVASTGATLLEFATPDETIAAVRNGEADAVLADLDYLVPLVNESNGELHIHPEKVLLGGGVGMAVRQSDNELRETFDKAIGEMKADGSIQAMITKWFGPDAENY